MIIQVCPLSQLKVKNSNHLDMGKCICPSVRQPESGDYRKFTFIHCNLSLVGAPSLVGVRPYTYGVVPEPYREKFSQHWQDGTANETNSHNMLLVQFYGTYTKSQKCFQSWE